MKTHDEPGASEPIERMDRRLALAFGALILALVLTVAGTTIHLYAGLNRAEEDRLARTIARVLEQSINKVAFSGKYHTRLLVEEMKGTVPDLAYISVESERGTVIAHSDPSRNGTEVAPEQRSPVSATGEPTVSERRVDGRSVKEVVTPYRGGLGGRVLGAIRIGLDVEPARETHRRNLLGLLALTALLAAGAIWAVLLLSRRFGGAVRVLAVQLQGIADSLPGVICRFHLLPDGAVRMGFASQAAMRLFGLESPRPGDFLAVLTAGLEPEDRERFYASVRVAATDRKPWDFSARFTRADGRRIWLHCIAQVAPLADGSSEFSGVLLDVTERQQAEEALRTSEVKLRSLFAAMRDVIIVLDAQGRYVEIAPTSAGLLYRPPNELLGKTLADVLPEGLASRFRECVREVLAQGAQLSLDYLMEIAGQPTWFSASVSPYTSDSVLWVARDITDRKRAEAEKDRLRAQLTQSQKMESVGLLAGGVAHDFNNMLGVILGRTEMALDRVGPDIRLRSELEEVRKAAERSADLTRQLLAFARQQTVAPKVLDPNEMVQGTLNLLRRLIGEDIDLLWKPGHQVWAVKMDPAQLDQILANLCVNARDAIVGVGKVTIETDNALLDDEYCASHPGAVPGEYVLLTVSDDGCGMDAETCARLFEPFFTTKERGRGTGLGLATVYGAVRQNDGFIDVYSEPGRGATFRVYLPRHHTGEAKEAPEERAPRAAARGTETILLVEDEPSILGMTAAMLERLGYTVLPAGTPSEAIRLAEELRGRLDLLLTDVVMPEMNGRDLAASLKRICPGLQALFMSGYPADVVVHHGVLDEGVLLVQKPFSTSDLAAKVREALGDRA